VRDRKLTVLILTCHNKNCLRSRALETRSIFVNLIRSRALEKQPSVLTSSFTGPPASRLRVSDHWPFKSELGCATNEHGPIAT
jgi:hypothetical protein